VIAVLAALALAVIAAVYLVSLRFHPWWPCWRCRGTGRTRDRVWKRARGTCPACGGRGQRPRLGIRVLNPDRARRMRERESSHRRIDERRSR
jgi:hypothetical protein